LLTLPPKVLKYLDTAPGPLHKQDQTRQYDYSAIPRLSERLRECNLNSDLAKGELLMILNLRPSSSAALNTMVEDMEERFTEDEQNRILEVIAEVLGQPESSGYVGGEDDAVPSAKNGTSQQR
jgi:hypothetical protein